jgi:hypothetical protein
MVLKVSIMVVWVVTPCRLVDGYQHFVLTYMLHSDDTDMYMEAVCTSTAIVAAYGVLTQKSTIYSDYCFLFGFNSVFQHSHHHPGNSSASLTLTVHAGMPSPTLHRPPDDKWHNALCANFVHEYKQYLQTLGFIPIHTEPASPRKG